MTSTYSRHEVWAEAVRRGVEQRRKQGLPPLITDPELCAIAARALASAAPPAHAAAGPDTGVDASAGGIGAAPAVRGSAAEGRFTNKQRPAVRAAGLQDNAAS